MILAVPIAASASEWSPWTLSPSISFFVSFGRKTQVGVAVDARVSYLFDVGTCQETSRGAGGFYGRVEWFIPSGWRFGVGVHGGHSIQHDLTARSRFGLDAELGWTFLLPKGKAPGVHGIQLGLTAEALPFDEIDMGVVLPLRLSIPLADPQDPFHGPQFIVSAGLVAASVFGASPPPCIPP